jgi:hypothetical protein
MASEIPVLIAIIYSYTTRLGLFTRKLIAAKKQTYSFEAGSSWIRESLDEHEQKKQDCQNRLEASDTYSRHLKLLVWEVFASITKD